MIFLTKAVPSTQPPVTTEAPPQPKLPEELALDSLIVITSAFSRILGAELPWKVLREKSSVLDQQGSQWTNENAELLGDIKTKFLNVFDAYDSCEQSINEWCSYASSTLRRYIQLAHEPSVIHIQLLVGVLENAIKKIGRAQKQFDDLSSAIVELDGQLHKLEANLQRDYNENSAYFKKRLDALVKNQPGGWLSKKKSREELAVELKKELEPVLAYFEQLAKAIQLSVNAFKIANSNLPKYIHAVADQKVKVDAINGGHAIASVSPSGAIHAAEFLVAACQKYRDEHVH